MCVLKSPGVFVEFEVPSFIAVLVPAAPILVATRGNGVDFHYGSIKSTLVPSGLSATSLYWAIEFLKSASNLDCMAQELSA